MVPLGITVYGRDLAPYGPLGVSHVKQWRADSAFGRPAEGWITPP